MPESHAGLPPEWTSLTLEQIASKITSGATPTSGSSRFYVDSGGLPFAKTEDLTRSRSKFIDECELAISDAAILETAAKRYPAGTILVSMYGTIGLTKIAAMPMAANQALCALIPPFLCHPSYLFHHLEYVRDGWSKYSGQTTQANINGATVRTHEVPLPPPEHQAKIAEILDTFDAVIQKTEALIDNLKAIKQGLLHDLLTRGIDANGQLRPLQTEAPHLYEASPLGWMPKGWELLPLGALANVSRGKFTHRPRNDPRYFGGKYPFIQTGDVAAAEGGYVLSFSQTLSELGTAVSQEFPAETIAVTIAANIADTGILSIPMYFPDSVVGATVHAEHNVRFVELSIRKSKRLLDARAPQSAQKNINLQDLRPLMLAVPPRAEQDQIAQRYEALQQLLQRELAVLDKCRREKQALMDDLLTGRVRVTPLLKPTPA